MTWTYNVANLSTSTLMQVRREIGDVLSGDQQLQDEEINWVIGRFSNIYMAAAECCRMISAQFSRQVDTVQAEMRTTYSTRARNYEARAIQLERLGLIRSLSPYAGGISVADKESYQEDTDRVPPDFNTGQFDDLLPVGPVGQQTPSQSIPEEDSNL